MTQPPGQPGQPGPQPGPHPGARPGPRPGPQPDPAPGGYPPPGEYLPGGYVPGGHPPEPYGQPNYPAAAYGQPTYPAAAYGQSIYPAAAYGQPGDASRGTDGQQQGRGPGLAARLGPRVLRRPEPRFGVSLAAAGVALAIAGILIWAFGYLAHGLHVHVDEQTGHTTTTGSARRFLGAGLSLALTAAGYLLVISRRRGPLATAGVIGAAIGVPLILIFLTLDLGGSPVGAGDYPVNVDVVFLVSIFVWLVSYFALPGTRGRAVYVGLAASSFASYLEYKAAGSIPRVISSAAAPGGPSGGTNAGSVAAVGLIFGLAYYAAAAFLDHRGRSGAAIGLVYAGFVTTATGIVASIPSFKQVGTGVELVVLGALLSWYGGRYGRRFTSWVWAGALVLGVGVIVQKIAKDNTTAFGITLIVLGAVAVAAAHVFSTATREPAEIADEAIPATR